ncbi:PAS domain-containing sensor histidine kinase, partial [filamentous cyanobacterium CCP1]
ITARKQAEAQLQQVQLQNLELLETDRLKNQFIANISHELRTPLNAILGFTELMQRYVEQENAQQENAQQQNSRHPHLQLSGMIERIFRNGRHLLALIEELLDFSRLKAERLKLNVEPFDIVELVRQVVEETRPLADSKALEIRVDAAQACIAVVNDPVRVRQILVNLLSNAIKFTDKGSVTVEVGELPDEKIVLMVQDTGIGIAEEDLPYIFSEFWQVNPSTTRSQGGTGLGLAIVRAIVELMQGCISVDSQLDRGTTVRIEIPQWLFTDAANLFGREILPDR